MDYMPLGIVEAWPADDPLATVTVLPVLEGSVVADRAAWVRTANFTVIQVFDTLHDDYDAFATQLYQRGTLIRIRVTEDGDFTGLLVKTIFDGAITAIERNMVEDEQGQYQIWNITAQCPFAKARANGLNMSRQTRNKTLDIEFYETDFDPGDPNFLVNIPLDSAEQAYEYVPGLIVNLRAEYVQSGDAVTHTFNKDEFEYAAGLRQIMFKQSQADMFAGNPPYTGISGLIYKATIYYYDPTDLSNTVKEVLSAVAAQVVWGELGGMGYDSGDVDLEEIYGFGSNPKIIRSVLREKTDGPITQFYDELRESGLMPSNYWLRHDPPTGFCKGSHLYQDNISPLTPANGTLDFSSAVTMEAVAGRCEFYGLALTPQNVALGKTVTTNVPALHSIVPTGGSGANIVDGDAATFCNFQYTATGIAGYAAIRSANDAMLIDLGEVMDIRTLQFKQCPPIDEGWVDNEYPAGRPMRRYESPANRKPKITISASESLIDASNPGIPVNDECIGFELDPLNTEEWQTWECTNIHRARYIAIRWEQDGFWKTSDSSGSGVYRTSFTNCAELKVLNDGRLRFDKIDVDGTIRDHPAKGQVPYVELKGVAQVTTVAATPDATHCTLTDVAFADAGDFIQIKPVGGDPVLNYVSAKDGANQLTITPGVPGMAAGNAVGDWNRWVEGFDYLWHDTYYPMLRQKGENTNQLLEIQDEKALATDTTEAMQLCWDRLQEMIGVHSDNRMEICLDIALDIGSTVRPYSDEYAWLVDRCTWKMNRPNAADSPGVTMLLEGTNYEETPE
jgi:hypothetical protein